MTTRIRRFLALPILRKQTVVQATVIIAVLNFLSKFIGYAREVLIAKYFGTSWQLDAYLVGSQIPMMVLGLFAGGFGTVIIPQYLEYKKQDKKNVIRYVNQIFVVWGFIFLLVSILTIIFARPLVHIAALGFNGERFELSVKISRYLALYGLLNILLSLLIGIFQAEKQFLIPAFLSLVGNIFNLMSITFLTRYYGIQSLTIGCTLLVVFNFTVLFVLLYRKYKIFNTIKISIKWSEIIYFGYLSLPLAISTGMAMLNNIADKTVASSLQVGSISIINYSSRIWGIPMSLIAASLAISILPHFSYKVNDNATLSSIKEAINKALIFIFYFMLPISILFITTSEPIVRLFYQRGAFNNSATLLTANVNRMYSLGLVFFAAYPILFKVFYVFKKGWIPLIVTSCSVVVNYIGNVILSKNLGVAGIALSTTIVSISSYIVTYYLLNNYIHKKYNDNISTSVNLIFEFAKMTLSSLLIGSLSLIVLPYLNYHSLFIYSILKISIVYLLLLIIYIYITKIIKTIGYSFIQPYIIKIFTIRR